MASTIGTRLAFEKAKEGIKSAGFSLGQAVLSQSFLRTEVTLNTNSTLYQFPVLVNDNFSAVTNTSKLLALQDAFYASEMALLFCAPSSATDTTFPLVTYPNTTQFPGANEADSLHTFYNGIMTLTINNRQIIPAWDLYRHYYAPQQQQTTDADYTTSGINYVDQNDASTYGFVPVEPGIVFVGSKQNQLQVQLPASLTAVTANSRAVLIFRGHLAQNVSSVR